MAKGTKQKVIRLHSTRKKGKGIKLDKRITIVAVIIAVVVGVILAMRPNAYQISIDGEVIGAIKDIKVIEGAKETVITQLKDIYGSEVQFEEDLYLKKYRASKKDYIDPTYLISYMRKNMDILIGFKELYVEGEFVAIISSEKELESLKEELKKKYYGEVDVEVEFGKEVELKDVFAKESELISMEKLVQKCTTTTPKKLEYEVKSGDTLSGIANRYNTTVENIISANNSLSENANIRIGQVIEVNMNQPLLPLSIVEKQEKDEAPGAKEGDDLTQ